MALGSIADGRDWCGIAKSVRRQGSVLSDRGVLRRCRPIPHAVSFVGICPW